MIAVIGSGYIGSFIADYLASNDETIVIDRSETALSKIRNAKTFHGDLNSARSIIDRSDIVVTALPGNAALEPLKSLAEIGKDVVDISFLADDPMLIGDISERKGSFYVPHCGFAPGLTNMLAGNLIARGYNQKVEIYCGGLPLKQENALGYKVTWSSEGLIDEYTRKARYLRGGKIVESDPLEDIEVINFAGYGGFEAFYSDGLATLLGEEGVPDISEKTLRYPGHLKKIRFMNEMGMFSNEKAGDLRFRDYTARILENLPGSEEDQCFLMVKASDSEGNSAEYWSHDVYDKEEERTSMCRMTGLTCSTTVLSLLDDPVPETGLITPESLGKDNERMDYIISRLSSNGIEVSLKNT